MHPLDALYRACRSYPGGVEALARRLGVSPATLYNKLRQQMVTHHVHFDTELSEILFCLRDANVTGWDDVLHAFCWRHGYLAVPVPNAVMTDDAVTSAICRSVKEHGEAIAQIGQALIDSSITKNEMAGIDREIEEAMSALAALRQLLHERHQA
jgi:hypothetical protein